MALRDTQGRCKPSTNCFKTRIHRLNAGMKADYENTYDSPHQEQFSGTQYSVRWPWFFNKIITTKLQLQQHYNTTTFVRKTLFFTAFS